MSTGLKAVHLKDLDEKFQIDQAWLGNIVDRFSKINPGTIEFNNFKFVMENYNKIVRNKKLIDLLG